MRGFERLVEARIQEAQQRGALDNLEGAGKPLVLDDLCGLSQDERAEALVLRSQGGAPEEVTLLREIAELRGALGRAQPEAERARLRAQLREKTTRLSVLFERSGRYHMANEVLRSRGGPT